MQNIKTSGAASERSLGITRSRSAVQSTSRLHFVDHLRTTLTVLVVLHHVSLVYGASLPGYYYVEPPFTEPLAFRNLLIFAMVNQAWFMGAFFLLAGYFTPGSFDRKGASAFLKERLLRLGIPLLAYTFILGPIAFLGYFLMPAEITGSTLELTWANFWQAYPDLVGMGPLWFAAMLLVFSFGYVAWRMVFRTQSTDTRSGAPGYLAIALFILVLAAAGYGMRMIVPLDESVFQFPTLAYLPQYLGFFILGIAAVRRDWLRKIPGSMGAAGLLLAAVASIFLFPLAFSGRAFSLELTEATISNLMGDGHWQSAVYALWDSACAVGMVLALVPLYRSVFNAGGAFGRFLARNSYTVYIIHIPIIVFTAFALRGVGMAAVAKFGLVALIVVPLSFIAAALVRRLPFAARVL